MSALSADDSDAEAGTAKSKSSGTNAASAMVRDRRQNWHNVTLNTFQNVLFVPV